MCDPQKGGGELVTMWIPTPSMTRLQRTVLYGTCALALVNSVGLLLLLVQQNQHRVQLEQTEARLTEVEQSSVVEFLKELPREHTGTQARAVEPQPYQYLYSRNKRSEELDKEVEIRELHQEEVHQQEVSQEVDEEVKVQHKHRHGYQKTHMQDDMMMMMTYSMVPVSFGV